MTKLPLRLNVLYKISRSDDALTVATLLEILKCDYGNERQFNERVMLDHLLSLKENGLIYDHDLSLDSSNKLQVHYKVTEEGINSLKKYLPKGGK